jgi:hypothetical protein
MAGGAAWQPEEHRLTPERAQVLRRTLRPLPQPMLAALARGLDKHRDELVAGRLFNSPHGGGCPVGVMLRELDPARCRSGLRFWLRDRWRGGSRSYRGGALAKNPRLKHLEWIFDGLVVDLRERGLDGGEAARAAGRLVRQEVERELEWRDATTSWSVARVPDRQLDPAPADTAVGGTVRP